MLAQPCWHGLHGRRINQQNVDWWFSRKLSVCTRVFWGDLDQHIPAEQRRQVTKAMREANKQYVEVVFSNADHGFFCDARKSYEPGAARLASDITRSFLDARL